VIPIIENLKVANFNNMPGRDQPTKERGQRGEFTEMQLVSTTAFGGSVLLLTDLTNTNQIS